jgi:hypothetical protein
MGDTVNLAARLMGLSQNNEINCDLYVECYIIYIKDIITLSIFGCHY